MRNFGLVLAMIYLCTCAVNAQEINKKVKLVFPQFYNDTIYEFENFNMTNFYCLYYERYTKDYIRACDNSYYSIDLYDRKTRQWQNTDSKSNKQFFEMLTTNISCDSISKLHKFLRDEGIHMGNVLPPPTNYINGLGGYTGALLKNVTAGATIQIPNEISESAYLKYTIRNKVLNEYLEVNAIFYYVPNEDVKVKKISFWCDSIEKSYSTNPDLIINHFLKKIKTGNSLENSFVTIKIFKYLYGYFHKNYTKDNFSEIFTDSVYLSIKNNIKNLNTLRHFIIFMNGIILRYSSNGTDFSSFKKEYLEAFFLSFKNDKKQIRHHLKEFVNFMSDYNNVNFRYTIFREAETKKLLDEIDKD
jgi:hypothetical protein